MSYNYTITRFKVSDWDEIDVRDEAKADFDMIRKEIIFNEIFTNAAPFYTLRCDNKVIFIWGISYGGMYSYFPCIVASKEAGKHARKIRNLIYDYFAFYVPKTCRRLEAYCDIMDKKAVRLAQYFGFSIIGIRHYASAEGHDQVILEKLMLMDPRKETK